MHNAQWKKLDVRIENVETEQWFRIYDVPKHETIKNLVKPLILYYFFKIYEITKFY